MYVRDAFTLEALADPLPVAQVARVCTGLNGQKVAVESLAGETLELVTRCAERTRTLLSALVRNPAGLSRKRRASELPAAAAAS